MQETTGTLVAMPLYGIYISHMAPIVITILICIWVRYALRKNNKYMIKIFDEHVKAFTKLKNDLGNASDSFATNVISMIKNNNVTAINREPSYKTLFSIFNKIKEVTGSDLYKNMVNTNAWRIGIYLFHNGTRTPNGLSFLKMSCIGEIVQVGSGIKERAMKHSSMMVNIFDDMYTQLIETGRVLLMSSDESVMNSGKAEFISAPKIQYSQAIAIYDTDNNIIGFVLAEFGHGYNKTMADTEAAELTKFSEKLTLIFSVTEYVDLTMNVNKEQSDNTSTTVD